MQRIIASLAIFLLSCFIAAPLTADTTEAKKFIMRHYVGELPKGIEKLPWSEFQKYIDRYTDIYSQQEVEARLSDLQGVSKGRIGIRVEIGAHGWLIKEVVPYSPAYYAGLRVGDVVVNFNDSTVLYENYGPKARVLPGKSGQHLAVDFMRDDSCHRQLMYRTNIYEEPVSCMVSGKTLCVRISQFNDGLYETFMRQTESVDPTKIDTILFDLRDNPGGLVDETLKMLGEFVEKDDTLMATVYRDETEYNVSDLMFGRWRGGQTIVVLQNDGSASASELFAGTLAVRRGAIIVGDTSYGKGRVQRIYTGFMAASFADGNIAGVKLTIAKYLAGGVLPVDSIGVIPTVNHGFTNVPYGKLPQNIDVVKLRYEHIRPSFQLIDSMNALGHGDLASVIWGSASGTYSSISEMRSVRHQFPVPYWSCTANHNDVHSAYAREDEEAIRKAIGGQYAEELGDSILRLEPVERLLEHVRKYVKVLSKYDVDRRFQKQSKGMRELGLTLELVDGKTFVVDVRPGSSAYRAGICVGDRFMGVNGRPPADAIAQTRKMVESAVRDGFPVKVAIRRGRDQFYVSCNKGASQQLPALTYVSDGFGFIASEDFVESSGSVLVFWKRVEQLQEKGMNTLVIDLRNTNGGGYSGEDAASLAELFYKGNNLAGPKMPVYLLVDSTTSGSAELFAYHMQVKSVAKVIGSASAGMIAAPVVKRLPSDLHIVLKIAHAGLAPEVHVVPDIPMVFPTIDPRATYEIAAELDDVSRWRNNLLMPTDNVMADIRDHLPSSLLEVGDVNIAAAVYGSGARLYTVAPYVKRLISQRPTR